MRDVICQLNSSNLLLIKLIGSKETIYKIDLTQNLHFKVQKLI